MKKKKKGPWVRRIVRGKPPRRSLNEEMEGVLDGGGRPLFIEKKGGKRGGG